ncbi:MAG: potassium-transporting ATPase subunit KdpC [Proteobacteria bacterium]|nr:potassium-transporting ATPase subunit KdpC [Pseudomonadota bacterium]
MLSQIRPAIVSTLWFTALLGVLYPLGVTAVAENTMPNRAAGSMIKGPAGQVVGSALIAQSFARPEYFHSRPSAAGKGYDATSSGGSNLGPLHPDLAKREAGDADAIRKSDGATVVPADAVTTSGSGLDPDISPANARMQANRVALARGVDPAVVRTLVDRATEQAFLGFIGQPRVNVLKLNMALDAEFPVRHAQTP